MRNRPGSARPVVREAVSNLRARAILTLAVVLSIAALAWTVAAAEADSAVSSAKYGHTLLERGYDTYSTTVGQGQGTISSGDCLALDTVPGIEAAVWIGQIRNLALFAPNGPSISVADAGGDIEAFLRVVDPRAARAWNGQPVVIDQGNPVATTDGRSFAVRLAGSNADADSVVTERAGTVAAVRSTLLPSITAELTALGSGFQGGALLVGGRRSTVQACDVLVSERIRSQTPGIVGTAFPVALGYSEQWVLPNAADFESPHSRFEGRISQWLWLYAAAISFGIWLLYMRLRRSEFGLYAMAGVGTTRLALMLAVEGLVFVGCAALISGVTFACSLWRAAMPRSLGFVGWIAGARYLLSISIAIIFLALVLAAYIHRVSVELLKDR